MWCARWNEEIAHIYPKTKEGQAAPLRRYDVHGETPHPAFHHARHSGAEVLPDVHGETPDVAFARRVHLTLTRKWAGSKAIRAKISFGVCWV